MKLKVLLCEIMYEIHFSLEKFKAEQKTISQFKMSDGSFTSDQKFILAEWQLFYKNLYSQDVN